MIYGIIILVILMLVVVLNICYIRTNHYYNSFLFERNFLEVKNQENFEYVVTGTSNALAAVCSFRKNNNILIISGRYQSLRLDKFLLYNQMESLKKGSKVFLFVSPCVLLYDKELRKDIFEHASSLPSHGCELPFLAIIKRTFPIIFEPKRLKYIFIDVDRKSQFYPNNTTTTSIYEAEKRMSALVESWKKTFRLKEFTMHSLSKQNLDVIDVNKSIINTMLEACQINNLKVFIVTTPMSSCLLKYYGEDFLDYFRKSIHDIIEDKDIPFLDFMQDADFVNTVSLITDGGFILNKSGSEIFMRKLIKKCREFD